MSPIRLILQQLNSTSACFAANISCSKQDQPGAMHTYTAPCAQFYPSRAEPQNSGWADRRASETDRPDASQCVAAKANGRRPVRLTPKLIIWLMVRFRS